MALAQFASPCFVASGPAALNVHSRTPRAARPLGPRLARNLAQCRWPTDPLPKNVCLDTRLPIVVSGNGFACRSGSFGGYPRWRGSSRSLVGYSLTKPSEQGGKDEEQKADDGVRAGRRADDPAGRVRWEDAAERGEH